MTLPYSALANHLWQSTLVVAFVCLLNFFLRRNRAALRHSLWLAASVKFLVPFSLLVHIGNYFHVVTPSATPAPALTFVMKQMGSPFVTSAQVSLAPAMNQTAFPKANAWEGLLLAIWICGSVLVVASWIRRSWKMRTVLQNAVASPCEREVATVQRCLESMPGVSPGIRITVLNSPVEPGVLGILRPVLVLPAGIAGRLDQAQLESIITHELSHVRRRDNLISTLHTVVEAIFWFHPLVWWLGTRLVDERERACDEEVVRLGNEPRVYAEGILQVCRFYIESPAICVSRVSGSNLTKRVQEILSGRSGFSLGFWKKCLLVFLGTAVITIPLMYGLLNAGPVEASAQSVAGESLAFEVASVKPNKSGSGAAYSNAKNGRVTFTNGRMQDIFMYAFGVKDYQIEGPGWFSSERYDIVAKAPEGSRDADLPAMVQTLLRDRFQMKIHRETRDLPIYALLVDKAGHKLKELTEETFSGGGSALGSGPRSPGEPSALASIGATGRIPSFADLLSRIKDVGRPVIDRTELTGRYEIRLRYLPDSALGSGVGPSIFTALQEELGLRLQPENAPIEIFVIDNAAKVPTENGGSAVIVGK
jgi:bla regulator protein blaR1